MLYKAKEPSFPCKRESRISTANVLIQIAPLWIVSFNQLKFPSSVPLLYLLFPANSGLCRIVNLMPVYLGSGLEILFMELFFVCYFLNHFTDCSIVNAEVICNLFQSISVSNVRIINLFISAPFPS